ncbi:MAG: hypothetical protein WC543_04315 [Candidatus Omnitrophota bacterium]
MNIVRLCCNFVERLRLLAVLFLILFSLGMASAPKNASTTSLDSQTRVQVDQSIASLKSAYELKDLPGFTDLLDKDFENKLSFQSNLENYFNSFKDLELMMVIDTVLMNKDQVSVRLHWFKKSSDNLGSFAKSEGSCQFVFINRNQKLKLLYIRGKNPFF